MLTDSREMLAVIMTMCSAATLLRCCSKGCSCPLLDLLVQGVPSQIPVVLFELQASGSIFAVLQKLGLKSAPAGSSRKRRWAQAIPSLWYICWAWHPLL